MNKLFTGLLIATVLGVSAATASACPSGRIDQVVAKLELTTEQETKFREIMQAKRESMKSYREAQRAETLNQLKNVLTEEQLAEFEEMIERRFRHRKGV